MGTVNDLQYKKDVGRLMERLEEVGRLARQLSVFGRMMIYLGEQDYADLQNNDVLGIGFWVTNVGDTLSELVKEVEETGTPLGADER